MSAAPADQPPLASRAFDSVVIGSGLVVTVLACALAATVDRGTDTRLSLLLAAPVIALMSRYPLMLDRRSGGIEVGFDSAVLVFLAVVVHGWGALAAWCVGVCIAQLPRRKRPVIRLFNAGLGCVSGAIAQGVMEALHPLDRTSPRELLAVGVGCAIYFLVDYALSGISIALEESKPVFSALRQGSALVALGVFVAIDTLGYLAALVVRSLPAWSTILLAVPVVTILVATRALASRNEQERRLGALFAAATSLQTADGDEQVFSLLLVHACDVALSEPALLRDETPNSAEVGAPIRTGDGERWLVLPRPSRSHASLAADEQALETLAKLGEEALSRIALVEEMGRLARSDALTGLPNRAVFQDRVEHAVAIGRRHDLDLAVLFLDLDGFKGVNDRFGHDAGDRLLTVMAQRLCAELREGDTVARLGGDEFAILVEQVAELGSVDALCGRLLATIARELPIHGHDIVVSASIGVAVAAPEDDADSLLRNADMAMYRAKAEGKGRHAVYQPALREANLRRLDLLESLRRGIARDLVVHYQPVVDLEHMRVHGVEALVRWQRDGQVVGPDAFIGAAEESGLIDEIGERVLDQVIADAPALVAAAGRPIELAVNVSAHQLRSPDLLAQVRAACSALAPSSLVLEMTERVVIGDDEHTAGMLRSLANTGARLALDDFGVGFSSIGYLQHLPVHILKIDRSFVERVACDRRTAALIEAMVVMGQALELEMVAEGVEHEDQLAALRDLGCRVAQGFYFARPMPRDEVVELLRPGALAERVGALVRVAD